MIEWKEAAGFPEWGTSFFPLAGGMDAISRELMDDLCDRAGKVQLEDEFENGQIQEPPYDPDLAIVLAQVRKNSVSLFGSDASDILEPVPMTYIRRSLWNLCQD